MHAMDRLLGNTATLNMKPLEVWPTTAVALEDTSVLAMRASDYCSTLEKFRALEVSDKKNYFSNSPLFQGWTPEEIDRLCHVVRLAHFNADEVIQEQGQQVDGIFFVNKGERCCLRLWYDE